MENPDEKITFGMHADRKLEKTTISESDLDAMFKKDGEPDEEGVSNVAIKEVYVFKENMTEEEKQKAREDAREKVGKMFAKGYTECLYEDENGGVCLSSFKYKEW